MDIGLTRVYSGVIAMLIWLEVATFFWCDFMTLFDGFPENRFAALEEVQELLGFKRLELLSFLATLGKADDAFLRYGFGDLSVTVTVNEGLFGCLESLEKDEAVCERNRSKTLIRVCLEMAKENVERSATYQFTIEELERIDCVRQLKVGSVGGA
jgi:hypothetical protein